MTQGKRTAALDAYQKANAVAKSLARRTRQCQMAGRHRRQLPSHRRRDDEARQPGAALAAFEQNLAIIQKLASNDPGNESIQADLASSTRESATFWPRKAKPPTR